MVFNKVNETGLNEPWAGVVVDSFEKHEGVLDVINDGMSLINSKCSAEFNKLPDYYFVGVFIEIQSRLHEILRSEL